MTARVLVVEDHADIAAVVEEHLRIEGLEVSVAHSAEEGLAVFATASPTLVILDLMLPGMSGQSMLRALRTDGFDGPVLILSAKDTEVDKVHGFKLGADDYVTKPFGVRELLARVHALLRRCDVAPHDASLIQRGRVVFDPASLRVLVDGIEVNMRPKARDLLFTLLANAGEVVSRARLLREVWGYAPGVGSRTVDWHVAVLRRRLHDDRESPSLIRTVPKVGYRLVLEPRDDGA